MENKPVLKQTLGVVWGVFVPLHISLKDVKSVKIREDGEVNLKLTFNRSLNIPLEKQEHAQKFLEKIEQLIDKEKTVKTMPGPRSPKIKKGAHKKGVSPSSYGTVPYYFPTEQTDIVDKSKRKRRKRI